ncbi:MAG: hypothetical protein JWN03_3254 [Nocardia sp.]|uniref:hypothetical protein n=1 Tax=Nocardia sp. TaxID=1821 RepID=UPI00260F0F36|nr:hypothetical protein [Nocardia sp.]MCU1642979.1 hypothetical protein [Nocardia sp.]
MSNPTPAPSDPAEANAIHAIRSLVEAKDLRAAKQQLRQLQATTDDATWAMVVEIANTLRFKTHTVAVTKLRNLWRNNEQFRPLIEACAPKAGEHQHIPEPPSVRADNGPIVARASEVRQDIDPDKRVAPKDRRRNPNKKIIEDYEDSLAKDERDDPGIAREEPIVGRRDYEAEALTHVPTTLCVSCRLERAAVDRHTDRVRGGLGDDGLCGECRSLGRPGLPELSPGHTVTDQVHARLDFVAEHFPTGDRGIFRQEWRYADESARPIISAWVKDHTSPDPDRRTTVRANQTPDLNGWCEGCSEYRQLAPGSGSKRLCFDCDRRYQRSAVHPGSVEPAHRKYGEEVRSASGESRTHGSSDGAQSSDVANESGTRQGPASAERGGSATKPEASVPSVDHRRKLVESAREKARAAAQERRRGMTRQPTAVARPRTLRH